MIRKYGLLAGGINISLSLAAYLIQPLWFFGYELFFITWLVLVVVAYRALREERSELPEYTFRQAVRTSFGIMALAMTLYQVFYNLMIYVFDRALIALRVDINNQRAQRAAELFGNDPDTLMTTVEESAFSFQYALFYLSQSLIVAFLVSAVLALMLKTPARREE